MARGRDGCLQQEGGKYRRGTSGQVSWKNGSWKKRQVRGLERTVYKSEVEELPQEQVEPELKWWHPNLSEGTMLL